MTSWLTKKNFPVFTEEGAENVRNFKYRGGDNSLVYKYFYSPLCDYLIQYVPANMAYNEFLIV
jgi:hypothetical protein